MDTDDTLTWSCEAFGVPDVTYNWFKNGKPLEIEKLDPSDQTRYSIQDNVLTIRFLKDEKDSGMYQCRARNTLKTRYSSAQLKVLSKSIVYSYNANNYRVVNYKCICYRNESII